MADNGAATMESVTAAMAELAREWAGDRSERQTRRSLDRDDFDRLRDAGFLRTVVPVEHGGLWEGASTSARPVIEILRTLARSDSSVALVAAMHPAVVAFWLLPEVGAGAAAGSDSGSVSASEVAAWEEQRGSVFATAMDGHQWGTITSEPGSGGDIARTKAAAKPDHTANGSSAVVGERYRLTGDKHFGSGSGISSYMMTTGLPDGEDDPSLFALDVRDRPWEPAPGLGGNGGAVDRSGGMTLIAEWDGMGMAATQSHAMRLDNMAAVRSAWPLSMAELALAAGPFNACVFTGVVLGVLDAAVEAARERLTARADDLRAFEQTEWTRAEMDYWLAVQAYEGGLRALESESPPVAIHGALRAKQSVARLAEDTLARLSRVLGGGTFSGRSPFAHWYEDVRALGFLRPPWALAYDSLFATSLGDGAPRP